MMSRGAARNLGSASMLTIAALLCPSPAAAQQDACGTLVDGVATCSNDDNLDQGIRYDTAGDLTINLEQDLSLDPAARSAGIIAISEVHTGGAVTINGRDTSITATDAIGAVVEAEGDVVIDLASITTSGATPGELAGGLWIATLDGSTSVNIGSVETNGDLARAIVVESAGAGSVLVNAGSVSTGGFASDGITVTAGGLTEIHAEKISGRGDAIWGVNVRNGIESQEEFIWGDTFIDVGSIDLVGTYNAGIILESAGSASIRVGALNVDGASSTGIYAAALQTVLIDVGEASFKGENSGGITASAGFGDAIVKVGSLSADGGPGVAAASYAGTAIVEAGTIDVKGDFATAAAASSNYGNAAIRVNEIRTEGFLSKAIDAFAIRGKLDIRAGAISTNGQGSYGIQATGRTNLIHVAGDINTRGDGSVGILSSTTRGDNIILVDGNLSTTDSSARGIWAIGRYGSATIHTAGSISTSGDRSDGIHATGEDGEVRIDAQSVTTSGTGANGIHARTRYIEFFLGQFPGEPVPFTGNIAIRAAEVAVTGEKSIGISAKGLGDAQILAGNISSRAGSAIDADMIGSVALDLRGKIISERAAGVVATASDISVIVGESARVSGASDGLLLNAAGPRCVLRPPTDGSANPCPNPGNDEFSGGIGQRSGGDGYAASAKMAGFGGTARITNRGSIEAGTGFAVRGEAGTFILHNEGRIVGAIQFAAGDDLFENRGVFRVTKDSDFGGGTDILRNSGTLQLAGGKVRLAGLDRFENSGLVDLRNGAAGDALTLPGDYAGTPGATLYLDVDGAAQTSDRLIIEGSASGSTLVALAGAPSAARLTAPEGIVLIEVKGRSSADAFVLAEQTRDVGLVRYTLAHDAASGDYALVGRAGAGAYRQLGTLQAAGDMWSGSADLWRSRGSSLRDTIQDGEVPRSRLWGSLHGGRFSRDWRIADGNDKIDLDYRMTRQGGQLGYDIAAHDDEGTALRIGITGGYSTARLGYRSGERIKVSTANLGLYANYAGERLFANLLVKYDRHDVKLDASAFESLEKLGGSTWGAASEIGFRFGTQDLFVEPTAGFVWTHTAIDTLATESQQLVFEDNDMIKARLGARVGGTSNFQGGDALTLFASANAVQLIGKDYALTITSGASDRIEAARLGTYGEGRIGMGYRSRGGFELFAEGQAELGSGYDALTGRAGFRIAF